ncbi:MAG: YqiA/YcfP family alpha/beta fold hydrolase, partial [Acholeplasma sp.]|nr:YqiA/YcfP family alpha/beta fold hydrolase [Acholeplasma sp.]
MIINHREKISFKLFVIISLLTLISRISRKKLWSLVENKKTKFVLPLKKHKANVFDIEGIKVIKFSTNAVDNSKFVVYFHGGGFVMSGNRRHYSFLMKFNKMTNFNCYYIDYPLAPKHKAIEVISSVESVVNKIFDLERNKELILVGDSAGGNLALVIGNRFSIAKDILILSPWLDLTMTNKKIEPMEKKEIMFSKNNLLEAAKKYQGNLELDNILISPIYNDFSNKRIGIFAGTDDLLFPDVLKFTEGKDNIELH